jgi:sporulation protein YlmC with PRC-barrel domain
MERTNIAMEKKEFNSNQLKGKEIIGPGGGVFGKVDGVNFDTETWQISTIDVKLDGKVAEEIGVKKRFGRTEMPMKASFVGQIGDRILLNVSRDELTEYVTNLRVDTVTKAVKPMTDV